MGKKYILKILTAGEGGVGKTTLLHRYVEGVFSEQTKMTIGVEFFLKEMVLEDCEYTMQLWDFGGQQRFRFLLDSYVVGAKGALLMFDLTRLFTLKTIKEWVEILRKYDPNLPILFVGTKLDLTEQISVDDDYALSLAEQYDLFDFLKISSKTGENIDKAFEILIRNIFKKQALIAA